MSDTSTTHLTEMAEFFPTTARNKQPCVISAVSMQPGETMEEAVARQQERSERIRKQIADRKACKG